MTIEFGLTKEYAHNLIICLEKYTFREFGEWKLPLFVSDFWQKIDSRSIRAKTRYQLS